MKQKLNEKFQSQKVECKRAGIYNTLLDTLHRFSRQVWLVEFVNVFTSVSKERIKLITWKPSLSFILLSLRTSFLLLWTRPTRTTSCCVPSWVKDKLRTQPFTTFPEFRSENDFTVSLIYLYCWRALCSKCWIAVQVEYELHVRQVCLCVSSALVLVSEPCGCASFPCRYLDGLTERGLLQPRWVEL